MVNTCVNTCVSTCVKDVQEMLQRCEEKSLTVETCLERMAKELSESGESVHLMKVH